MKKTSGINLTLIDALHPALGRQKSLPVHSPAVHVNSIAIAVVKIFNQSARHNFTIVFKGGARLDLEYLLLMFIIFIYLNSKLEVFCKPHPLWNFYS